MELILPGALGSEPHPPAHIWLRLREDTTLGQLSGGQTLVVVNSRKSQCVALRPQLYTISIAACVSLNNLCITFMRPSWRLTKKPLEEGPCLRIPRGLCHSALLKRTGHLPSGHEGQGTGKALPQNIPWGDEPTIPAFSFNSFVSSAGVSSALQERSEIPEHQSWRVPQRLPTTIFSFYRGGETK